MACEGIAAPASAVDPVMETFGRPRAHSLTRRGRQMSLPEWKEGNEYEDDDSLGMEDRRRTVSMSAEENLRQQWSRAPKVSRALSGDRHIVSTSAPVGSWSSSSRPHAA